MSTEPKQANDVKKVETQFLLKKYFQALGAFYVSGKWHQYELNVTILSSDITFESDFGLNLRVAWKKDQNCFSI